MSILTLKEKGLDGGIQTGDVENLLYATRGTAK